MQVFRMGLAIDLPSFEPSPADRTKHMSHFREFFSTATAYEPYPYQERLAAQPWPNFLDVDQSVSEQLKVKAIPKMFLMDANGILISDALRGEELATQLAEFFK